VLEQGVYAGMLFFYSRRKEKNGRSEPSQADLFVEHLLSLAQDLIPSSADRQKLNWTDPMAGLEYLASTVCSDLNQTVWIKTVWEQALTYVRYGAKSISKAGAGS